MINVIRSGRMRMAMLGIGSALLVTACGGGDVEGMYYLQMGPNPGEGVTMELRDDGVAIMSLPEMVGMPPSQGTHKMEDGKVVVQVKLERNVFTIEDDGNLSTIKMGDKAIFVKQ